MYCFSILHTEATGLVWVELWTFVGVDDGAHDVVWLDVIQFSSQLEIDVNFHVLTIWVDYRFSASWSICSFSVATFFERHFVIRRVVILGHDARWFHMMARSNVEEERLKHDTARYCANSLAVWSTLMIPFVTVVGVYGGVGGGDVARGIVVLFLSWISHSSFWFLMHVMIILLCFMIFIWNFLKMAMHSSSQSFHMDTSVPVLISSKRKTCFAFSESSSVRVTNTWTCGEMVFHFRPWQLGHLLWWWWCDVVRYLLQNSCGRLQCQQEDNSGY